MTAQAGFVLRGRNPDVLTCIANLSNDEVFTPPEFANRMLDTLAEAWAADHDGASIWANETVTFLDPCTKSGVFLREIVRRLNDGLAGIIEDRDKRIGHILKNQIFGIAITNLTSLLARRSVYCSKYADSRHSIFIGSCTEQGNIRFERVEHTWEDGKCIFCGAGEFNYERGSDRETHAYKFIHSHNIKENLAELFGENMQFDVVIGNPPYQLSDNGYGRSASPVYQLFVEQAKRLNPRYLSMVIPSRWYAGGKGLDEFRLAMLGDRRMRKLVDFENSAEFFPGVDVAGGICYFLWDSNNEGFCEVVNLKDGKSNSTVRALNEFSTFIRQSEALPIVRKVKNSAAISGKFLSDVISSRKPFGLPTNYDPKTSGIPCWFTQRIGLRFASSYDVSDPSGLADQWKLLIPPAPIAGQTDFSKPIGFYYSGNTRIARPGEVCTESWLVACAFATEAEVISFRSYLFTKIVRFLILQSVVSQHVTKEKFGFVPDLLKYDREFDDRYLCELWGIDESEWNYIDSRIKAVD